MDDKGRSLEHLAQQIQRITLVEVQKSFLSGQVDEGATLLSQWEEYLSLSKNESTNLQGHETLSSTIKLFCKRLGALQNVLNSLPKQKCVKDLQEKLTTLEERFDSTKVGVGGGTFEWVDSVLVKCLREGCWLLVDNVNLCSPAVLDRLNGLLEPGGELVVGERGVSSDGRLVTVRPHPAFRLFLVMDPHYGEISRAMRNRGVEICLLGSEENPPQFMDLQAVLDKIGITHYNHQKAIINIHEEMKNLAIGVESITDGHLLQVATSTVQQIKRGRPVSESLRSACSDVYVLGRQLSLDQRDRCSRLLDEIFKLQDLLLRRTKPDVRDALDTRVTNLKTLDLQENSAFALLQQKCALLSSVLKLLAKSENSTLKDILKDDVQSSKICPSLYEKKLTGLIPQILVTLVSCLSENDLCLRRNLLLSTIMLCRNTELRSKLSELEKFLTSTVQQAMKKTNLTSFEGVNRKDLCWDLRRVSSWVLDTEKCVYENRTIALLYYFMQYLELGVKLGEIKHLNIKNISALDFSTAYNKGKVTIASVSAQVVLDLSVFLEAVEDQVYLLLDSQGSHMDPNHCCQLICAFHWSHRLIRVAQRSLFLSHSQEMEVSEDLLMLLNLHIHWVKKWLLPRLPVDRSAKGDILWGLCSTVSLTQPVRSLSRRVRTLLGQPLPLSNRLQGEALEIITRCEGMIDLTLPDQPRQLMLRKVEFLLSLKGKELRLKLAKLLGLVRTTDDSEEVLEELKDLELTLTAAKLNNLHGENIRDLEVKSETSSSCWEIPLWPLKGVVCLRLMSAVLNNNSDNLISALISWMRDVPLFPLSMLTVTADANNQLIRQLSQSLVVTSPRPWLSWGDMSQQPNGETDTDDFFPDERRDNGNVSYPLHCPVMALFTTSLLYPRCHNSCDHNLAAPSLHSYKKHARMLASLGEIIWDSTATLASATLNYRQNEVECIEKSYTSFLHKLETAVLSKLDKRGLISNEKDFLMQLSEILQMKASKETRNVHGLGREVESLLFEIGKYLETLEKVLEELKKHECDDGSTDIEKLFLSGQAWTYLGLLQLCLFSHQDQVDPVQKKALKLKYTQEEIDEVEMTLAVEEAQALILGVHHFPLAEPFSRRLEELQAQEHRLTKYVAKRPSPNIYTNLYNEIQQLMSVMVRGSGQRVEATVASLQACLGKANSKASREAMARAKSLLTSVHMSVDTLNKRYGTWYPDVVVPIVSAISQISHGIFVMNGAVEKHTTNLESPIEILLKDMVRFPLPDCSSALRLVDVCTSTRMLELLEAAIRPKLREGETAPNETFRLAKCSLQELSNVVSVKGKLGEGEDWSFICLILNHLVMAWQKQEQERAHKEEEENKFFINKARKIENLTEEEEDAFEMRKLFPSYRDRDFADLEPPSLEQTKNVVDPHDDSSDPTFKLSLENILEIHKVHSAIVTKNTRAHWIHPVEPEHPNFTSPFVERLTVFSVLLNARYTGCDSKMEAELTPPLILGVHLAKNHGSVDTNSSRKHYDFYHDANVNEVKLCVPIMESLKKRVLELLEEWPDHPTLNQIITVINRVMGFPSHSPVSRFLVGLELLLTKLKEWEENAHAGVTLGPHAHVVTRQILDWRKLELSQWRGCLESARIRLCEGVVSKWWFHLYSLVQETGDTEQLTPVLEKFMESSSLGEYQTRLDLLYTFHFHCINSGQRLLGNVFWNVYQYYAQFSRVIQRRIKDLCQPIEKKLKDFVKIARWNDINYWAVKETVDKTHRTLFKYIREYEAILKQPATIAMTKLDTVSSQSKVLFVNAALYVAPQGNHAEDPEANAGDTLLCRERSLFARARKLCRDIVANCPLPQRISALHQVVELLQDVAQLLNTEDIDRNLSKDKQKSLARSVLHRKRAGLTDVFHSMASLGLSYRAGLMVAATGALPSTSMFTLHDPLNLDAGLAQIDHRSADRELIAAWKGCDEHFLHAVAFLAQLRSAMTKPHKDLGPAIVDRCKGFTNHLMAMCHEQKKNVSQSVTSLYELRCLIQQLSFVKMPQICSTGLTKLRDELVSLLEDIIYCLAQFNLLMDASPEVSEVIILDDSPTAYLVPDFAEVIHKGDEQWAVVKSKLSSVAKSAKKCKSLVEEKGKYGQFLKTYQKTIGDENLEYYVDFEDLETLQSGHTNLIGMKKDLEEIQHVFKMKNENDVNPLIQCLVHLQQKIEKYNEKYLKDLEQHSQEDTQDLENTIEDNNQVKEDMQSMVETLLNKILFTVQEFYKSNFQKESETSEKLNDQKPDENEDESKLFDNHLKVEILNVLKQDKDILSLPEVTKSVYNLLAKCQNSVSAIRQMKQCIPLLQQYSLLAQFVVTQQISALRSSAELCSSLLTLFIDLANKGFRMPEELLEEEDGEGTETTKGGMGLGEGEGQKDVSEEIESQDQLEDAKKPGEHEQDGDKDCKEEEKGIEMSDDFGGKLQDMEKKENEEGSGEESGDEEEPDKEMGETDKGAETLDQQIWGGSDLEDEEEETENLEEEQGDRGEQMEEKQMAAKDDDKTPQRGDDDDEESSEQKKDKQKEINELEEPDIDDDQIDPYHGKNQPPPEPEPLDLPDDLQLDDGEGKDKDEEGEEENPFDIDAMKEPKLPEEKEAEEEANEETDKDNNKKNQSESDSSDEEEAGEGNDEGQVDMDVDDTEDKEDQKGDDGGAKDDNKTGEEQKMDEDKKKEEEAEEANPSEDLPASEPVPSSLQETGSKDQVKQPENSEKSKELSPEENAAEGPDEQGVGAAHQEQREAEVGARGESRQAVQSRTQETREEKRERPGESEDQRALGDVQEPLKKKLKTINIEKESESANESREEEGIKEDETAEMYQHIKEAKESKYDAQTMDAATEEQAAEQKLPNKEDEDAEPLKDDTDLTLDQDEPQTDTDQVTSVNPEKLKEASEQKQDGAKQPSTEGERIEAETKMEVEGEVIETATVQRGADSWFHTNVNEETETLMSQMDVESVRRELEQQLASWNQPPANDEAVVAWERLCTLTADLSRELSEQLRLVLEPTHASRLRGDFRTGRRINMRKVIPYIASQFRKDKIWLRRTKPAKREYQIVLAIDDSSSMADNHSKELAFESLAVVSKALSLLEAGQLAVLSFGETPRVLHQLGDSFTEQSGARLLQQFSFEQQKTQVGALVNFAVSLFERVPARRGVTDIAQLLVIVSDGRGVLNDGEEVVRQAVRRAKHSGVFMVFVIVDNPHSKDSILDIRLPKFSGGKLLGIVPYMDSFPFPFYLILRDINSLPSVLSDALRQWFELVTTTS